MKHFVLSNIILKTVIIIFTFSNLTGCKKDVKVETNTDNSIEVSLNWKVNNDFKFNEIYYTEFPVYTEQRAYPKIYNPKIENYRNIPKLDSFVLVNVSMQDLPSYYNKYLNKYRTKEDLIKYYSNELKDTISKINNPNLKYQLNAISGFIGNQQIVIPDLNNNNDFKDDPILKYPITFRNTNNISKLDSLPLLDFSHQLFMNGKTFDIKRSILLYPKAKHRHVYLLQNTLNERLNSYTLFMELKDYAKGKILKDSVSYTVAIQGKNQKRSSIVIKPDSIDYPPNNHFLQSFFSYENGDTLSLGEKWYKIESIYGGFSTLKLSKVKHKPKASLNGLEYGGEIKNQTLTDLNGQTFELFPKNKKKKMTLVEFWGTWCGPCIELTPKVIELHKQFEDEVRFISVASDKDVNEVKAYVKKNKIKWEQAFTDQRKIKNTIIGEWNIRAYPTFILIDDNQKMVYAGTSGEILENIRKILTKKFNK
jgi:thiol-disulfide isomerase/thioredoxin